MGHYDPRYIKETALLQGETFKANRSVCYVALQNMLPVRLFYLLHIDPIRKLFIGGFYDEEIMTKQPQGWLEFLV